MPSSDRIDELKKRYDENPRRFFASLANEYRKAGDLEQAITICQAHLAEQPSNMNGHVVYGQALFEAGRYDEAKTTFEAALNLDPENLIALRHLGDIACTNGENDSARIWYERVLDADPRNEEIIALLAHLAGSAAADIPRETTAEFTPPRVITPSTVPLDSVKTLQIPAVQAPQPPQVPQAAPRESIGLMDLSIDFETAAEAPAAEPPVAAEPPAAADLVAPSEDEFGVEFASFGEAGAEAGAEAEPAPDSAFTADATGDLLIEPFADPFASPTPSEPEPAYSHMSAQPEAPAAPFVTETMAELYLQQGFTAEALDVYRQLSAASPEDETLKERVRNLERPPREQPAAPSYGGRTARAYFARLAARRAVQGNGHARPAPDVSASNVVVAVAAGAPDTSDGPSRSLDQLFGDAAIAPGDEQAALAFAQVAGAVEMGSASVQGKPTAPASSELSLDSVFRAAEPRTTASVARQSQTLRFDQFFAAGGDEGDAPAPAAGSTPAGEPGSPAELQQFQSWLTGLKKP